MSRILFAWELGANLGHLTRDLPLARACRDAGHEVIFAVANLRTASSLLHGEHFTLVQAPSLNPASKGPARPVNYADMLLHLGYDDADALVGALEGWMNLFKLAYPALLIYNHAPTALLAARMVQLPTLLIGTGFEIPPAVVPLPSFRPWLDIPHSVLLHAEARVLVHINLHLANGGHRPLARLSELFLPSHAQLTTFAELDPFGPRPGMEYIGPIHALPKVPAVVWHHSAKCRIFAYLRPSIPGCVDLLTALQTLDAEVICVLPGLQETWTDRFDRIRFLPHPVDLSALLPDSDLVVTYGTGTIATALLSGVPVLLVPQVIEQFLAGLPLERTCAGRMLRRQRAPSQCSDMLHELLGHPGYRQAALDFAQKHREFSHASALARQWQAVATALEMRDTAGPIKAPRAPDP